MHIRESHPLPDASAGGVSYAARRFESSLESVRDLARCGQLDLEPPGSGSTWIRWSELAAWARFDVAAARIVEGHVDALAILDELGHLPLPGLLGVWAAEDRVERLRARRRGDGWELSGVKRWCSGAALLDAALVTAWADDGCRTFLVPRCRALAPLPGSWPAIGMSRTDSRDVSFRNVRLPASAAVGSPQQYVQRPGFWHGAAGVAACWYGGALGIADALVDTARERPEPHRLAHLGAVKAQLAAARSLLQETATAIDGDPADAAHCAEERARTARAVVESVAVEVLDRVGRATGADPLAHDAMHAHRVSDLTVYLRQSHAEQDLEQLGRLVVGLAR